MYSHAVTCTYARAFGNEVAMPIISTKSLLSGQVNDIERVLPANIARDLRLYTDHAHQAQPNNDLAHEDIVFQPQSKVQSWLLSGSGRLCA